MGRPRKYPPGQAPTPVERSAEYVARLREAGGRRRSYNWRPAVAEAIETLKTDPARAFQDETTILGDVILAAAAAVSTTTKTRPKKKTTA